MSKVWCYTLLISGIIFIGGCGDSQDEAAWTLMVYMAGDNNLSSSASKDLAEMEAVGSTPVVNVVVQMDTLGGTNRRLFVNRGKSTLIEDLGEKNMADRQTLLDFILWAKARYPAHRYALILWSHGDGVAKALPPSYKILQDDTDRVPCCLSNTIVHQAIKETGVNFNLLGFDASQMGQVETAYEFRDVAKLLVFSQETGQSNGWDYAAILDNLIRNPFFIEERELAGIIVNSYQRFYEKLYKEPEYPDDKKYHTISAINLREINLLAQKIDSFANALLNRMKDPSSQIVDVITAARAQVQELNPFTKPYTYIDLFDFLEKLKGNPIPMDLLQDVEGLIAMRGTVIISEWHGPARPNASGLSIVFFKLPEALTFNYDDYSSYFRSEKEIAFLADTRWRDLLNNFYRHTTEAQ